MIHMPSRTDYWHLRCVAKTLYPGVEEIDIKRLYAGCDSLLCVRVCCKLLASRVLRRDPKRRGEISTVERVVRSARSPVDSMGSKDFHIFWSKLSTFWLHKLDTDFFYARIQALVTRWNKWLNVNGDYVQAWCAPSTCHVYIEVRIKLSALGRYVTFWNFLVVAETKGRYKYGYTWIISTG
jgi:hypothetical protein